MNLEVTNVIWKLKGPFSGLLVNEGISLSCLSEMIPFSKFKKLFVHIGKSSGADMLNGTYTYYLCKVLVLCAKCKGPTE